MVSICRNRDKELLIYLRDRGVNFKVGIEDYEAWQEEIYIKEESCKKTDEVYERTNNGAIDLEGGGAGSFSVSASYGRRRMVVGKNRTDFTPVEAYLNTCLVEADSNTCRYEDELNAGMEDFLTTFDLKGKIEHLPGVDEMWEAINEDERGYRIRKSDVQKIFDALHLLRRNAE